MLAPIVVFGFNRPDNLERLFLTLKSCDGFQETDIIVYIDGPRNDDDEVLVNESIAVAYRYSNDVRVSKINKGLGASIINGVSEVLTKCEQAIVLEDDLVCSPGFIAYINECLVKYRDDERIISVCGYGLKIARPAGYYGDVYLCNRSSSWGWATWKDRWEKIDWNVVDFAELSENRDMQHAFNKGGSDMYGMLKGYVEGKNKSWAIRFCYSQFKLGMYSIHPFVSFVDNYGFGEDATNCKQAYSRFRIDRSRFESEKQDIEQLKLPYPLEPNPVIIKECSKYHSLYRRIYSRVRRILRF